MGAELYALGSLPVRKSPARYGVAIVKKIKSTVLVTW